MNPQLKYQSRVKRERESRRTSMAAAAAMSVATMTAKTHRILSDRIECIREDTDKVAVFSHILVPYGISHRFNTIQNIM